MNQQISAIRLQPVQKSDPQMITNKAGLTTVSASWTAQVGDPMGSTVISSKFWSREAKMTRIYKGRDSTREEAINKEVWRWEKVPPQVFS